MQPADGAGDAAILREQAAYYRARAGEYDQWWQRQGRYDRGSDANRRWHLEVAAATKWLESLGPGGDVLELAAGTGWWTERLARHAAVLTCLDASPEALGLNRARLAFAGLPVPDYRVADLFARAPDRRYDLIFFSFWLSHVPASRFEALWATLREGLKPDGRAVFIDSAPTANSGARDHRLPDADGLQERLLDDGRRFRVVKLFHEPSVLATRLAELGWRAQIGHTDTYFILGTATLAR